MNSDRFQKRTQKTLQDLKDGKYSPLALRPNSVKSYHISSGAVKTSKLDVDGDITLTGDGRIVFGPTSEDYLDDTGLHFTAGETDTTFIEFSSDAYTARSYLEGAVTSSGAAVLFSAEASPTGNRSELSLVGGPTTLETMASLSSDGDMYISAGRVLNLAGDNGVSLQGAVTTTSTITAGSYLYASRVYPGGSSGRYLSDNGSATTTSGDLSTSGDLYVGGRDLYLSPTATDWKIRSTGTNILVFNYNGEDAMLISRLGSGNYQLEVKEGGIWTVK